MAIATLSVACLIYWAISLRPRKADFETVYIGGLYISADSGVIRVRPDQSTPIKTMFAQFRLADDEILAKKLFPAGDLDLYVEHDSELTLPGLHYRRIEWRRSDYSGVWMLSLSPLIPFVATALLAGLCLYRYVVACRPSYFRKANFRLTHYLKLDLLDNSPLVRDGEG